MTLGQHLNPLQKRANLSVCTFALFNGVAWFDSEVAAYEWLMQKMNGIFSDSSEQKMRHLQITTIVSYLYRHAPTNRKPSFVGLPIVERSQEPDILDNDPAEDRLQDCMRSASSVIIKSFIIIWYWPTTSLPRASPKERCKVSRARHMEVF